MKIIDKIRKFFKKPQTVEQRNVANMQYLRKIMRPPTVNYQIIMCPYCTKYNCSLMTDLCELYDKLGIELDRIDKIMNYKMFFSFFDNDKSKLHVMVNNDILLLECKRINTKDAQVINYFYAEGHITGLDISENINKLCTYVGKPSSLSIESILVEHGIHIAHDYF